ncbi:MAG: hypothetical protein NZ529_11645, partial [Cytophagaceae bacterium]|nr:hypothetical protein [Cytophagaceae bacterium]MDW8457438.1 NosD domain-containing protein [Cytophagaceae bacterium]
MAFKPSNLTSTEKSRFKGNKIGMDINGMGTTFGNVLTGLYFAPSSTSSNLIIGGTNPADRNIISMNGRDNVVIAPCAGTFGCGILIENVNGVTIQGNYIGVDATGNTARGNGSTGIQLNGGCDNVLIGGTASGARNVICANGFNCSGTPANVRHGVQFVNNTSATSMLVQGNYVGIGADGTTQLGNSEEGVSSWQTPNITIGGNTPAHRNVISGNRVGVYIQPGSATGCRIQGNYIGTDATGMLARPNERAGVHVREAPGTLIGGTGAGEGNVISGNTNDGILLENADNTVIQQNIIGLNATGTHFPSSALPNGRDGIHIKSDGSNGTTGVLVGHATNSAFGNKIAYNTRNGVAVWDANSNQNRIRKNSIFCNGTSSVNGVNLNGAGNANYAAPTLTVPPYITAPTPGIQLANGTGVVSTDAVEVFYDSRCGTCQGEIFLGDATVSSTNWSFSPLPAAADCAPKGTPACLSGVKNITATRTSSTGNTSQFMSCDPLLPVDLLSFKGKRYRANDVLLSWTTANEKDNSHFDILRGTDASTFNVVGRVQGAGTTHSATFYDFIDHNLEPGKYYYALLQVDYDGKQSLSNVIKISIDNSNSISIAP